MTSHSYFVVMVDYPWRVNGAGIMEPAGCQAVVDPEITRRSMIERIRSGEYKNIRFVHEVRDGQVTDLTEDDDVINAQMFAWNRELQAAE